VGVFEIINPPPAAEQTVALAHVQVHVLSMSQLADAPLTSSGRVKTG
jgi:hypothetical protein